MPKTESDIYERIREIDLFRDVLYDITSDRFYRDIGIPELCQRFFPKTNAAIELEFIVTAPLIDNEDIRFRRGGYIDFSEGDTTEAIETVSKGIKSGCDIGRWVNGWNEKTMARIFGGQPDKIPLELNVPEYERSKEHFLKQKRKLLRILRDKKSDSAKQLADFFSEFSPETMKMDYANPTKELIDGIYRRPSWGISFEDSAKNDASPANFHKLVEETSKMLERQFLYFKEAREFERTLRGLNLPISLPEILDENEGVFLDLKRFYPLYEEMDPTLYVMNDLTLTYDCPVVVLTGANFNGKSAFMKSVGMNVFMARTGGPIPAGEGSRILNPERIIYFRGEVDKRPKKLSDMEMSHGKKYETKPHSTFQSQLEKISRLFKSMDKYIARNGRNPNYLIMLNEPLSGTDVTTESETLAGILRAFAQVYHVPTIVETHFTDAALLIQNDPENYHGIQLLKFGRDEPFRAKPGVGPSEGRILVEGMGLTYEQLERKHDLAMMKYKK